jgi:hypothetical protein
MLGITMSYYITTIVKGLTVQWQTLLAGDLQPKVQSLGATQCVEK